MKIKTIGQLLDYVETEEKARELINYINKQKEVLDKIKEIILYKYPVLNSDMDDLKQEILETLGEIE